MNDPPAVRSDLTDPRDAREKSIILVTSLAHALCHIGELIFFGTMEAVMHQFGLKEDQVTALALPGLILMGAGALPVGLWADTWGTRRVLQIYLFAMAGAGLAVALAPSIWLLAVALTFLGLAASIYHPAGVAMLSLGVRARGRAMGINGVAGSIGVATSQLLGRGAAALGVWQLAYVVLAVLALGVAIFMYLTRRRFESVDALLAASHSRRQAAELPQNASQGAGWFGVPAPLACLFVAMMLGGLNYRCLVTALPPFFSGNDPGQQELFKGGLLVFVILVVGGIGQFTGGFTSDRYGARRVYPILLALLVPCALLLAALEGSSYALVVACGMAICLFGQQPVENSLLAEWTSARRRSVSYGTKFALTFGVGAVGAQIAGWIWRHSGSMAPVFYVIAASASLMGVLSWYASRRRGWQESPAPLPELTATAPTAITMLHPPELETRVTT